MTSEYDEGSAAYLAGNCWMNCPYHPVREAGKANQWIDGFKSAEKESPPRVDAVTIKRKRK